MNIEESNLTFEFSEEMMAIKFDGTKFYRDIFGKQPNGKGVDIIATSGDMVQFIEIKNCTGHEVENLWRTSVNNSKLDSAPQELDVSERDSLDIEMAKKVASTIACLYGAWTKSIQSSVASEMAEVWAHICDSDIQRLEKKILIVLFLEGDFGNSHSKTRNKKMIMQRLQDSIRIKLSWLNCRVSVVDSTTYNPKCFSVT